MIVIGGGIAGLATACLLARDGHPVTVLERNERVGGRAGTWAPEGWVFDTGPSWYLMPETFDHFFAMLGTSTLVGGRRAPRVARRPPGPPKAAPLIL